MVQGNGLCWVFGLQSLVQSPCLHLSVPWWRGGRGHRGSARQVQPVSADPEVQGEPSCVSMRRAGAWCPLCTGQSWHGSRTVSWLPAWPWPPHHRDHRPLLSLGIFCSISNCHLGWGHLSAPSLQHGPLLCGQREVSSPPSSPDSPPLLCPGPAWPPGKGRWVLGAHPLAG